MARYSVPGSTVNGNGSGATSFVRESDIAKGSQTLNQTIQAFEQGINAIQAKYLNEERKARLDAVKAQEKALEQMALEFLGKEAQIKRQTELEIQKLQLNGIKLNEQQRAKLEEANKKKQALKDKKELLAMLEENNKANQAKQERELKHIENQLIIDDPSSSKAEVRAAKRAENSMKLQEGLIEGLGNSFRHALNEMSNEVNHIMERYGEYQENINTRLQGSNKTFQSLEKNMTKAIGVNPYFKTEDMLDDLQELVGLGIDYNVEQRAFLNTISAKIADTFDAADASLLRIVQLQQSDSSAARLGMEAHLTSYLNSMFEDSQYLSATFDSVRDALVEASSQMSIQDSVAFEYQVQKWLGSLYSVGMSQDTVTALAEALGYLGSGNITGLNGSAMQSLLVMAASRAGLPYAGLLSNGLNESTTNILLQSLTSYLQEIGSSSSNVVKSQFAETFGVSISDLTAALNLNTATLAQLTKDTMSYSDDISELSSQLGQAMKRTSVAELLNNTFANTKFGFAKGVANDPVLSALWKVTDLIENYTGGIQIPGWGTWAMGNGMEIDLHASIEGLMKLGILGAGSLGMIGSIINGFKSTFNPASMLGRMGITSAPTSTARGSGLTRSSSGLDVSESALLSNSNGDDFSTAALNSANDDATKDLESKTAQVKESNSDEKSTTDIYNWYVEFLENKLGEIYSSQKDVVSQVAKTNTRFDVLLAIQSQQAGFGLSYGQQFGEAAFVANSAFAALEARETTISVAAPTGEEARTTANYLANIEQQVDTIIDELKQINTKLDTIRISIPTGTDQALTSLFPGIGG